MRLMAGEYCEQLQATPTLHEPALQTRCIETRNLDTLNLQSNPEYDSKGNTEYNQKRTIGNTSTTDEK